MDSELVKVEQQRNDLHGACQFVTQRHARRKVALHPLRDEVLAATK